MISLSEYFSHDATGLAELVRRGETTASDLLETAIQLAERTQSTLNAVTIPFFDIARQRARQPLDGPFAGVPFLLKDLLQAYRGVPTSWGNKALKMQARLAPEHDEITKRWLAAGVVPFAMTTTPEFGSKGITEPTAWGAARNPWDTKRTPGGSSGGSAAAVAAGIVPIAGANDGAGSIRIPASYTGLFGFKPGRGRTPFGPKLADTMHGAAVNHVLTRSVRDSALMLDLTHGFELGGQSVQATPPRSYVAELSSDPSPKKIAVSVTSPLGFPVDAAAVAAVENAARMLEGLGHHVEYASPDIDGTQLARDFMTCWFVHLAGVVDSVRGDTGAALAHFESDTVALACIGHTVSGMEYAQALDRWSHYALSLGRFFTTYDIYLTPAVAREAPLVGSLRTPPALAGLVSVLAGARMGRLLALGKRQLWHHTFENLQHVPFTQLANIAGVPAMSVPLHVTSEGLPMGVQFMAPMGGEGTLFALAGQLERVAPWKSRYPFLKLAASSNANGTGVLA